jgi:peptidase M23-like protein
MVRPERPLIEHRGTLQLLNFDFVLQNTGAKPLHLNRIAISVWDRNNKLIHRRELDENGRPSGLSTISQLDIPSDGRIGLFNPFYEFGPEIKIEKMSYEFFFNDPSYKTATPLDYQYSTEVSVRPEDFTAHSVLFLPVHQRSLIFDGHDFYSHHRRQNPLILERQKLRGNPVRYAYDFCPVNEKGDMYKDSPWKKENWYGYGRPIYAPAGGTVASATNDVPENDFKGKEVVYAHAPGNDAYRAVYGNFVVIDHGAGEFSFLAHMRTGSVRVKAGDRVVEGLQIGELGFAGDAFVPHLHYMLIDNPDVLKAEGVPSYFRSFRRVLGSGFEDIQRGQIDSGDIIEPQKR